MSLSATGTDPVVRVMHLLRTLGYRVILRGDSAIVLERRRPAWTLVAAFLFFPFGLVLPAYFGPASVTLHRSQDVEKVTIGAHGRAPSDVVELVILGLSNAHDR
jgi:hypothetical protein